MRISRYNLCLIGFYVLIFPVFFIVIPEVLRYSFSSRDIKAIVLIMCLSLLSVYLSNSSKFHKLKWVGFSKIIMLIGYAVLFAIPEEIIFRGIIQNLIQHYIPNIVLVVIISSVIFGLAHLPNGAKGLYPYNWNWRLVAGVCLAGIPLGLLFAITNSLLTPTVLHMLLLMSVK